MHQHAKVLGLGLVFAGMVATGATTANAAPVTATVVKPAGYSIVTATFDLPNGAQTAGFVACPIKKGVRTVPLSGGALIDTGSLQANINTSYPTSGGWEVFANNGSGADSTFIVYAVCVTKPTGYLQQQSKAVANPANTQNGAGYTCANGDQLTGGGAESSSRSTLVSLNSSWPSGTSYWYVYMNNSSPAPATMTLYHVCAKLNVSKTHYQLIAGTGVTIPAFTETAVGVECPSGLSTIGGGLLVGAGGGLGFTLNSSFPITGGWEGDENNATGSNTVKVTPYVLCAS
jgi:hypothetical protein